MVARRDEQGTGLVGTLIGFLVFLLLMFFGVQMLLGLYATTVVSSAAFDAARIVASPGGSTSPAVRQRAENEARHDLGHSGDGAEFVWDLTRDDAVVLKLTAARPNLLPTQLTHITDRTITRTVRVRREAVR